MSLGLLKDRKIWIGVLVSALFVWLALRGVDPPRIGQALSSADYRFLPPAVVLTFVFIWLRSLRWKVLMRGLKVVHTGSLFRATTIGFMTNYVAPARLGELVRAYLVGTMEGVSRSATFATVVVERLLDILSILFVFLGVVLFVQFPEGDVRLKGTLTVAAAISLIIASVGVMGLWTVRRRTEWLVAVMERVLGKISPRLGSRLCRLVVSFAQGIAPIQRGRDLLEIGFYTALLWIVTAVGIKLVAEAFHLGLPWEAAWVILVALAFGVSIPSAPGFVGTYHYAVILCSVIYGVPRSEALSYALVLHAANILPVFLLGLIFVWMEGLRLSSLIQLKRDELQDEAGS